MRAPDLEEMIQGYEKGATNRQALRDVIAMVHDTENGPSTFLTLVAMREAARYTFPNFLIVQYAIDLIFRHMSKKRTCTPTSHILGAVWVENAYELLNEMDLLNADS